MSREEQKHALRQLGKVLLQNFGLGETSGSIFVPGVRNISPRITPIHAVSIARITARAAASSTPAATEAWRMVSPSATEFHPRRRVAGWVPQPLHAIKHARHV